VIGITSENARLVYKGARQRTSYTRAMKRPAAVVPTIAPLVIEIDPELIVRNRLALRQRIVDALAEGHRVIVLDMGRCRQIDSAGLGVLVSCTKRAREAGSRLVFERVGPDLRTLLDITGLGAMFDIRSGAA
jgi:anti-anti-sigma factor